MSDQDPRAPRLIHRQLFLDDGIVERLENLRRVVNQPRKYEGNPVLAPDKPWEEDRTELPGSPQVVYDARDKIFRMYYVICLWLDRPHPYRCCYAESRDGLNWTKPVLGASEYEGTRENNLIGYNDSIWVRRPSVFIDDDDPDASRRYKMLYVTLTRTVPPRRTVCRLAFSEDGKRWRMNQGTAFQFGAPGQTVLGYVKDLGRWVVYPRPLVPPLTITSLLRGISHTFRAGLAAGRDAAFGTRTGFYDHPGVRTIWRVDSPDLRSWTKPRPVLNPDAHDPPRTQFSSMPVVQYEGLYIGLPIVYRLSWDTGEVLERDEGLVSCQLAVSRDTVQWERVAGRQSFLDPGGKEFELCAVYPTAPVVKDDQIFIYYGGYNFLSARNARKLSPYPDMYAEARNGWKPVRAVGVATLRRDGWVSLEPDGPRGSLVTKPFVIDRARLALNAVAPGGSIRVEIADSDGRPIDGFSLAACRPFIGDSVSHDVSWQNAADLTALQGQVARLRIDLERAKLFSYWLR